MDSQRLHITKPVDGWFGDFAVRLLEIHLDGGVAEHEDAIPEGARALLRFPWKGTEVEITAEILSSDDGESRLRFTERSEELRRLVEQSEEELQRAQEANAVGNREANVVGDETITAASAGLRRGRGYLTFIFENGQWQRRKSLIPDQPPNGFTVSAAEPEEQIEMLRSTYEAGNEDGRAMTRKLAELSAGSVKPK